jgi:hypothetical protein
MNELRNASCPVSIHAFSGFTFTGCIANVKDFDRAPAVPLTTTLLTCTTNRAAPGGARKREVVHVRPRQTLSA